MKRLLSLVLASLLFILPTDIFASDYANYRNTGIGVTVGSIDGLSLYHRYQEYAFVQGMLAFQGSDFYLSADVATAYYNMWPEAPILVPYFGFGGFISEVERKGKRYFDDGLYDGVKSKTVTVFGARIPLGLQVWIPRVPFQAGAEIVPGITLTPGTDVFLQHQLYFRVMF